MSDYFEQVIYDDGTYTVMQCQKRGYEPYFELYKPWSILGKKVLFRSWWFDSPFLCWGNEEEIKAKLKKLKEFPSPAVKFKLEEK